MRESVDVLTHEGAVAALALAINDLATSLPQQEDGPVQATAPNGQPYITVVSGKVNRPHGEMLPCFPTAAQAIAEWCGSVLQYAAERQGDTLWWRTRPEIEKGKWPDKVGQQWVVYSRLMIGNAADVIDVSNAP